MAQIAFPQLGVYFVTREPVRAPAPLAAFAAVRAELDRRLPGTKVAGSLSATTQNRFAIAACPDGLGRAPESSLSEVYEYDPVRYSAMVIGLVEPPAETPVHWIARRVNPAANLVAVVPAPPSLSKAVVVQPAPRGYLGDPRFLLDLGRLLKGREAAAIEGTGLVLIGKGPASLARALKAAVGAPPRKAPARKRAPKEGRAKRVAKRK